MLSIKGGDILSVYEGMSLPPSAYTWGAVLGSDKYHFVCGEIVKLVASSW